MIEVFKTNVNNKSQARQIAASLSTLLTGAKVNFDLHDCDRILRVEGMQELSPESIIQRLQHLGFTCELLD